MNSSHPTNTARRRPPLTEQLPIGGPMVTTASRGKKSRASSVRPFGVRFATTPASIDIDLHSVRYDTDRQIAVINVDSKWVPLLDPKLGLTLHTTGTVPTEDEVFDKDEKY